MCGEVLVVHAELPNGARPAGIDAKVDVTRATEESGLILRISVTVKTISFRDRATTLVKSLPTCQTPPSQSAGTRWAHPRALQLQAWF